MPGSKTIYTIGHSNHSLERFFELLKSHGVEVLVDVRSKPYTRYAVHFRSEELKRHTALFGLKYVWMGKELGGIPQSEEFYDSEGHVDYAALAASPVFRHGMDRLRTGTEQYQIALMCGEENPAGCHRRNLLAKQLEARGYKVLHLRGDGRLQSEADLLAENKQVRTDKTAEDASDEGEPPDATQLKLFG